ncbi:MAG TPA: dTDP-glucose 4,6-dehydratase [Blastocatellia bacterium]|nr:dTDP-glucose 4,6-dehydratase [Blastocatellia bacterium]
MKLFVTGGAGFIGSNYIRLLLAEDPTVEIVNFDALTYAGNLDNLADVAADTRYRFVRGDIANAADVLGALDEGTDAVVNFAAESHVDRSIESASDFVRANVVGTQVLLDAARARRVGRFVHISTDEVMGSLGPNGYFDETTPLAPNSPYAASKAAAEHFVRAAIHTHRVDAVITRCSNNYGPFQFPEKLIPLVIANAMENLPVPVYGDGMQVRDWIFVDDHCRAVDTVLREGRSGEIYCIGASSERPNINVVRTIIEAVGAPMSLVTHVTDRPGHDRRYAIDSRKIQTELGWAPRETFESGIARTVAWYREHRDWVERTRSGAYREYYERNYAWREGSAG